ncbi:Altered inheritance of mitochondria protein-like protein [Hapsidospora chrysogenum ATCC 11550]|uniref:Altered inheritance of mitochondria protein-like protein n=1 Tax=Hapsidospora chrysogenum (strain ATCC 11550 / CBS 779.69 / DSM 880 / IAM 14645 / JCM 23072 / IMI 49137) TaxID=857340 RepID=A0A086SZE1_HAPC1|nr:Altered inheritance of mitochondria protein-like protein [Hapsidospora chrysogenum ATCC 11550]
MLRPTTLRPILRAQLRAQSTPIVAAHARRTFLASRGGARATQDFDLNKLHNKRRDYEHNRTAFLAAGAIAGIISFIYTAWKLKDAIYAEAEKKKSQNAAQCDSPIPTETFKTEAGEKRKVILHDDEGREIVPTGNSVVQTFPRTIDIKLPSDSRSSNPIEASISKNEGVEFTLVGLGTRTVTFLGLQVYVVGFYVATQDIEKLQHYLVKKVNSLATTLIPAEKETLRKSLLDASESEETWDTILRDAGCRSAFLIAPVRDTDFHHLRDGFVRAITGRSQRDNKAYGDEQFGAALKDFKAMFNRGSVPKKKELLLCRDRAGQLIVMYDRAKKNGPRDVMGVVSDERLSRLLWLNYLAGSKVASEEARKNITDGVMEFVERPVGTVATQVL